MKRLGCPKCLLVTWGLLLVCGTVAENAAGAPADWVLPTRALSEAARYIAESAEARSFAYTAAEPSATDALGRAAVLDPAEGFEPPPGAAHYSTPRPGEQVTGRLERRKRWLGKGQPALQRTGGQAPPDWREVRFVGGGFTPAQGLDVDMAAEVPLLQAAGRSYVYGLLLSDEYPSEESRGQLEALGVLLLGPHGNAQKARFPTDLDRLDAVVQLPHIEWLGYPTIQQKTSPELLQILQDPATWGEYPELPLVVNLFDHDESRQFARVLEAAGAKLGDYDRDLLAYRAVAAPQDVEGLLRLDFVLFVEIVLPSQVGHDQSMATIGVDYIRPGAPGLTFDGNTTVLGILDTGFMLGGAAPVMHQDLNANGCGINFTSDSAGVWNDENGHGTHVLGTIVGRGVADNRYRGVATAVGNTTRIRAAKVWTSAGTGSSAWTEDAMDYMDDASSCDSPRPHVVNLSGGATGLNQVGTDSTSRKLDSKVYDFGQFYVVCGGNSGPGAGTIWSPGVAKNALAVGNVLDNGYLTVGDANNGSSRGPSGDGRMKPNLVGPGTVVTSARAGTTNQYRDISGCSMATPHVSGLAATVMQHYTEFQWRPSLLRAWLMASAILHDNVTTPANNSSGGRNTYGLGRVSSYLAHWAYPGEGGWSGAWSWGGVDSDSWLQRDLTVPAGTDRLVVVTTWDEPAASAGAPNAVTWDLDLWVDQGADCTPDPIGQCGEWASQSWVDNVEYLIINAPAAGTYRLKTIPWNAPAGGLPTAIAAVIIRGDPTPSTMLSVVASTTSPTVGTSFTVTTSVSNPAYVASGVHLARTSFPAGLAQQSVQTMREDGVAMDFELASNLTLGNIRADDNRSAVWSFQVNSTGSKTLSFRSWSENGGTRSNNVTINPVTPGPVVFASYSVDDDNIGNSVGNGNGIAECGETIELFVDLRNEGAGISLATAGTLTTSDPAATFLFNNASDYGDIGTGATARNSNDFDIALDADMPLRHTIAFDLNVNATNGGPWISGFDLPVACSHIFSDGLESGDASAWSAMIP